MSKKYNLELTESEMKVLELATIITNTDRLKSEPYFMLLDKINGYITELLTEPNE